MVGLLLAVLMGVVFTDVRSLRFRFCLAGTLEPAAHQGTEFGLADSGGRGRAPSRAERRAHPDT